MENQLALSPANGGPTFPAGPAAEEVRQYYLPPGYHFVPTEEELITDYLERKANCQPIPVKEMHAVNLYKFSPHYLAEHYPQLGNKEWYFFTPRDRKYPNGSRPRRSVADIGFWKATGADKGIYSKSTGKLIGKKKVLVFYKGKPKSSDEQKTNWIMHEYKLNIPSRKPGSNDMKLDDWVLCKVHEQTKKKSKKQKPACVALTKKGRAKKTRAAPPPLSDQKKRDHDDDDDDDQVVGALPPPPLAESKEIVMAPAGGCDQGEVGPVDYSRQFQDGMCELASILTREAEWASSLHDDSMGGMIYGGQDCNLDYGLPYIDHHQQQQQLSYPFDEQQQQWPLNLQQDSWAMTTNQNRGYSFDQDISNFINGFPDLPEPENGFLGHGGQGEGGGNPRIII